MAIARSSRPVSASRMTTVARRLLNASTLCAIATVGPATRAYVNTAYFAWSRKLDLVWLSEPRARHSRNLRENPSVAIAVYEPGQSWGEPDRGIQLFGSAREAVGRAARDAETLYERRFAESAHTDLTAHRFYRFRPRRIKLFDERALGAGVFVTARVDRDGRMTWERTEIYESS
jgi:uncharacterized protein YhbP (UPF0306 family)